MKKKELQEKTKGELLKMASTLAVTGRHKMNKQTLIENIMKARRKYARKKSAPVKKTPVKINLPKPKQRFREIVEKSWQQDVEKAKFEIFSAPCELETDYPKELPETYGETRITLMVRDPYWAYAYWEIPPEKAKQIRQRLGSTWKDAKAILRVYDITAIDFNGKNAHSFFDIEITGMVNSWYINFETPNRTFCVDIGFRTTKGDFFQVARSNPVSTPRVWMSDVVDEKWMSPHEDFEKVYALSGGYRVGSGSLELQEIMEKKFQEQISSPGISSMASEVMPKKGEKRGFWFNLDAELILYGATEPGATVTLQGKKLNLRPDGTFTARFALPDGKQIIPVTAVSSDGIEVRTIIPSIVRSTESPSPKIKK